MKSLQTPDKRLVSYEKLIGKEKILNKNDIEIKINNKIKTISLNKYRKVWIDEKIDFTCIEILNEDNIIEKLNPFEIDEKCYIQNYDIREYNKKGIILPSIGITE